MVMALAGLLNSPEGPSTARWTVFSTLPSLGAFMVMSRAGGCQAVSLPFTAAFIPDITSMLPPTRLTVAGFIMNLPGPTAWAVTKALGSSRVKRTTMSFSCFMVAMDSLPGVNSGTYCTRTTVFSPALTLSGVVMTMSAFMGRVTLYFMGAPLVRQDSFTDLVTVAAWAEGAPSTAKLVARPATSVAAANFVNRWFLGMPSL